MSDEANAVVAAVLAVTPTWNGAVVVTPGAGNTYVGPVASPLFGDPEPIAARQGAAAVRAVLARVEADGQDHCGCGCGCTNIIELVLAEIERTAAADVASGRDVGAEGAR